jgi:hypothetical protein
VAERVSKVGGGVLTFTWSPSPLVVARDYDQAAGYLENMTPPLLASRQLGIADVDENFAGEHDPDGNPWAPWSESYVDSFGGMENTPDSILNLTGDLWGSSIDPRAWPVTAREVFFSFGALPSYGIFHQEGASRASAGRGVKRESNVASTGFLTLEAPLPSGKEFYGQNDLPARPFAGLSTYTQGLILNVFDRWFTGALSIGMGSSGTVQTRVSGVDASGKKFGGRFGPKVGG